MQTYHVRYKIYNSLDKERGIDIVATNKIHAYVKAKNYEIPQLTGKTPYSAWVVSVTYANGNTRQLNTFEGKPY